MRRFRFNIANLLAAIFILGVGFAALRESSDLWETGLFTATLGVLLISILLAVHQTEKKRAYWMGFAIVGWIYLASSVVPSIELRLMTTKVLAYLDSKVPGRPIKLPVFTRITLSGAGNSQLSKDALTLSAMQATTAGKGAVRRWNVATGNPLSGWSGTTENFVRIGHSLSALLAAWLGGQLSRRLYQSSRQAEASMTVESGA